ncbi:MAG: heparan-alpha-glucosaminide N-acetyltransferase [Pseudomonadota bacterium]
MTNAARIELLDFARGVALVAMTVFHFAFDLELFGVKEPGFISQPHWKYFARSIATSFLFLAGFSLYLAHCNGIRWGNWRWRMAKIIAAALVITVATYFATPNQYIFFGILHAIAFASVAGLLFFRFPWWSLVLLAGLVFSTRFWARTELLDAPWWFWTGLSQVTPISSDYVPVFPWFSAPLLGIAMAKLCMDRGWLETLAIPKLTSGPSRLLKFMGRNSLVYYLLHQPVMIALLLGVLYASGQLAL